MKKIDKYMEVYEEYHSRWYIKIIDWIDEHIWWPIERVLKWPLEKIQELKWFLQRGKRGWADCDTWNLDSYLSGWLPQALKQIQKYGHCYPLTLTIKQWNKILGQMIEAFEIDNKLALAEYESKSYNRLDKIKRRGLELFIKYYNHLWN